MTEPAESEPKPAPVEGGLRERKKAENREEIMQAAREVFLDIGYGAATVRDIVRLTDLSPGTFYNYFDDKEEVFRAILQESTTALRHDFVATRSETDNPIDFVRSGFRVGFEAAFDDQVLAGILRRNITEVRTFINLPEVAGMMDDLGSEMQAAIDRGEMPQFDIEYMVAAMSAASLEITYIMFNRDPPDLDGATDFVTAFFISGLVQIAAEAQQAEQGITKDLPSPWTAVEAAEQARIESDPGLRERRKERNRSEILEAALEVFADLGFSAATVRDIVRNTELSPGTFYNYFPDKESLFSELVLGITRGLRYIVIESAKQAENTIDIIRMVYTAAFQGARVNTTVADFLRRNMVEFRAYSQMPEVDEMLDGLSTHIQAAIDRGELPAFDVEYMVAVMAAIPIEIAAIAFNRQPHDVEGAIRFVNALFVGAALHMGNFSQSQS